MAKEVLIQLRDDISDEVGDDVETRQFSFDGVDYEIELSPDNFENMRLDMKKWVQAARKAAPARKRKTSAAKTSVAKSLTDQHLPQAEIRAWARSRGYDVSAKGNISNEIRDAHRKAKVKKGR